MSGFQCFDQFRNRERRKLLDANHCNVMEVALVTTRFEVVGNLAAAEDHQSCRPIICGLAGNHREESRCGTERLHWRHGSGMSQERFRVHDNQRTLFASLCLCAQQVEIIGGVLGMATSRLNG